MTLPDNTPPSDVNAGTPNAVWPPQPSGGMPEISDSEAEIQKLLSKAQQYTQFAFLFYPMYIFAMVQGLKANRLGANGRGTKYIVMGSIYLSVVGALLLFILWMVTFGSPSRR